MMKVVSNSTPLVGLSSIGQMDLLQRLFGEVTIPQAVYDEVVTAWHERGGTERGISDAPWIKTVAVADTLAVEMLLDELDEGEASTIVLAREIGADLVLMDEKKGRRKLSQLGLSKIGTVGILLKAKEVGLLAAIGPELERLQKRGFSLSSLVVHAALQQANE